MCPESHNKGLEFDPVDPVSGTLFTFPLLLLGPGFGSMVILIGQA